MRSIRSSSLPPPPLLWPGEACWAVRGAWVTTAARGLVAGAGLAGGVSPEYTQAPRWDWVKASSAHAADTGAMIRSRQGAKRRIVTSNGGESPDSSLLSARMCAGGRAGQGLAA